MPATTTGKVVKWVSLDRGLALFPTELLKDTRTAVVSAKAPGKYRLLAITCAGDELSEPAICAVLVGTPPPEPPAPNPAPAPVPTPGPLAKAWLVVVEETSQAAATRGAYFADRELAGYLRAKGWKHRVADQDARDSQGQVPADLAPYLARARGKRLPYVFVVDQDGTPRLEGELPSSPEELLVHLKKIGG